MTRQTVAPFTGRKMAAIMVGFFAVVLAVNVFMAREASSTFGGVVVENSYVASQHYNRWLDEAAAQEALGWSAQITRVRDGHVLVVLAGPESSAATLTAVARHPLGTRPDRALHFDAGSKGGFVSRERLPPDRWRLRLTARAGSRIWRHEGDIR